MYTYYNTYVLETQMSCLKKQEMVNMYVKFAIVIAYAVIQMSF